LARDKGDFHDGHLFRNVLRPYRNLHRPQYSANQSKVPPNPWYGFRIRRTLNDPSVWYPANAAWRLLWVGVATMIVAITAYFPANLELAVDASIVAAAAVIGLAITFVQPLFMLANYRATTPFVTIFGNSTLPPSLRGDDHQTSHCVTQSHHTRTVP